ncbi:thioesterase family protein [Marinobacteraceae bacterium S3BR75-40.1]
MPRRSDYFAFQPITTRWMDNDLYGHVNNVTYYSYFDTAVNRYLIEEGGLDIHHGPVIGYVVDSRCTYRKAIAFPQAIEAGLRVERLGNSSVQYGIGIFRQGEEEPCAFGSFVHVFVDRETEQATPIPERIRGALEGIVG